jgi:putative PEP-CTERM system TPR-repeat lipoprotein
MRTEFLNATGRLLTAASSVALIMALAGCDDSNKKQSSTDPYARAVAYQEKGDTAAALIEIKNALQADPKNGPAHLLRARILMASGDIWSAEDEARLASAAGVPAKEWFGLLGRSLLMQQKPVKIRELVAQSSNQDPEVQAKGKALLGNVVQSEGNAAAARKLFGEALALNGQDIDGLLGMVRVELVAGSPDKAAEWVSKAQAAAPHDAQVPAAEADVARARNDMVAAETALRKAVAEEPNNPFHRLMLAQPLISNQKTEEADQVLSSVLKQMPDHPLANHLRAVIRYQAGKFKEVDEIETAVLSKAPNLRAAQFLDGLAKYRLGQYAQAEHLLQGVDPKSGISEEASLVRGASLLQLGRANEGYRLLRPLESKLAADPAYLQLAAAAARANNDLPKSRDLYQKAASLNPQDSRLLTQLASVKLDLGDTAGGTSSLERAIEIAPDNQEALGALFANLIGNKEFDKAQDLAQKEQASHPTKPQGWVMEGMVQALQAKMADAIASFSKALEIDPTAADATNNLAAIYLSQGRIDLARSTVEEGYKRSPKQASICAMGARVEGAAKNLVGVQTWLERDLEIEPAAPGPRADLIQILIEMGQPQKAVSTGLTGLQLAPGNPIILRALGQAYLAARQYTEASATLRDLVSKEPVGENYYLLATAYLNLHDEARLRDTLEQVIQKVPDFRPARMLLARLLLDHKETVPRAESMIAALAAEQPDNPDVIELQARAANVKSGPKAAVQILQNYQAKQKEPQRNLVLLMAAANWDAGQHDKAMKDLKDWIAKHPDDSPTRMDLASRQITSKRYDEARATLGEEIRLNPANWVAQNNLAWVLMTEGDLNGAQQQIDTARRLAGTQPDVLDTAGQIALAKGDKPHAVELLKLATAAGTASMGTKIHLAQALVATGNTAEARGILKSALTNARPSPETDEARALLEKIKN